MGVTSWNLLSPKYLLNADAGLIPRSLPGTVCDVLSHECFMGTLKLREPGPGGGVWIDGANLLFYEPPRGTVISKESSSKLKALKHLRRMPLAGPTNKHVE